MVSHGVTDSNRSGVPSSPDDISVWCLSSKQSRSATTVRSIELLDALEKCLSVNFQGCSSHFTLVSIVMMKLKFHL